jgi:DNA repair protein RadC
MKYTSVAREAVVKYQPETVDLQHVLAVVLGGNISPELCGRLAAIGVRELEKMSVSELQELGLTSNQAHRLRASFMLARKWAEKKSNRTVIRSPNDAYDYLSGVLENRTQEHFYLLCLDTKNHIIHERTVFMGSLDMNVVHPREIFSIAIRNSAASIIVAHNHPSGDPTPSREDIETTKRLRDAGNLIGIDLLDHLIIGDGRFVSLKERKVI